MKVDLIIPTYKPDDRFAELMKRLAQQTRVPDRILIMNTEEKYFTPDAVVGMEQVEVRHIPKAEFDHGGTRNLAASGSDADLICFMTQDALPADRHMIEELIRPFEDGQVAAAYGRQMADFRKNPIEAYTRQFNYPDADRKKTKADIGQLGIKTFFCSNVCAAYRKSDYDAMGGFETHTIFNEDMILASRLIEAGKAVYYASGAKVWHWHDYSAKEQFTRNFDLAVSQQMYGEPFTSVHSESEGIRLVRSTAAYLLKTGKWYLIPRLAIQSGAKYIGYRLGRAYRRLPRGVILRCSMNKGFWQKEDNGDPAKRN